jgi:phosphoadenosine phosphosulfate reductase
MKLKVMTSRLIEMFRGDGEVGERSRALEGHSALEIIAAGLEAHRERAVVSTAFGAAGLCVLDMAQKAWPEVRSYYIDTGFGFPETSDLAERWVKERGLNLQKVLPVLGPKEQAAQYGDALWASDPDRCCALRKVEPNERALVGATLWIAALRRDEASTRKDTPILSEVKVGGRTILKLCPIAGWDQKEVWRYIHTHQLPYNPLHDRGYPSVGCTHCTRPVEAGEDERAGRWSGKAKTECGLHLTKG